MATSTTCENRSRANNTEFMQLELEFTTTMKKRISKIVFSSLIVCKSCRRFYIHVFLPLYYSTIRMKMIVLSEIDRGINLVGFNLTRILLCREKWSAMAMWRWLWPQSSMIIIKLSVNRLFIGHVFSKSDQCHIHYKHFRFPVWIINDKKKMTN